MASKYTSRDDLNPRPKISTANQTRYAPIEMSDESVYHMAQHYYTLEEIAERFNVTKTTVLNHHGDAFRNGRDDAKQLPRFLLQRIMKSFDMLGDADFARGDVPVNNLLKAIELHARKYEGLGSTQTVITRTEDKPSVSDIRFTPLKSGE